MIAVPSRSINRRPEQFSGLSSTDIEEFTDVPVTDFSSGMTLSTWPALEQPLSKVAEPLISVEQAWQ